MSDGYTIFPAAPYRVVSDVFVGDNERVGGAYEDGATQSCLSARRMSTFPFLVQCSADCTS